MADLCEKNKVKTTESVSQKKISFKTDKTSEAHFTTSALSIREKKILFQETIAP